MPVRLGAALVAEFVGSFALTFVGILAIHHAPPGAVGLIAVALAHGLILSVMVSAAMPTSGGHLNPAVTIGFLLTGKIKPVAAVSYVVIQLLAGVVAALAVYVIFGGGEAGAIVVHDGTPDVAKNVSAGTAMLCEIVATFFLVFVIWGSAADPRARNVGGFAIGLTIAADILAVGPITGASMNPQRSFGPTLIGALAPGGSGLWAHHWIYWVGPIVGAVVAAVVYNAVLWPSDRERGIDFAYHNHAFEYEKFDGKTGLDILFDNTEKHLVKAEVDVYWVKVGGEDPVERINKLGDRCILLHLKDVGAGAEHKFAEVGTGILDFAAILAAAKKVGVKYGVVEQDNTYGKPPLEAVKTSLENLKKLESA
jgi:MIP family channel proteins